MKKKLVLILALCQDEQARYKKMLSDYIKFFSKEQGAFMGRRHTYSATEEKYEDPTKVKFEKVVTTPALKFKYFIEASQNYLHALLTKERTNASFVAKADLMVEGKWWGNFTSTELLAIKGLIESGEMLDLLKSIPVRSDTIDWGETDEFLGMRVWREIKVNLERTTLKESYILSDPNIDKLKGGDYKPQLASKDTPIIMGTLTREEFHSGWKTEEKAATLDRRSVLLESIIVALSQCNDCEVVETTMTADKLFGYIFFGNNQ